MSSVEYLREFVNERLTAAAEEIFRVFNKTIFEYEEEIDRQRKLLDVVWKELPQQHVCKEEEVLADQQLCIQERNSSLDQEDPEPPQIKEEQEELCTSQEEEQLEVKQQTETFMMTPTDEESDHSEDQTLYFNPDDTVSASETESFINMPVSSAVPEPNSDHQLLSHVAESQDQKGGKNGDSGSTRNAEQKTKNQHPKSRSHINNVHNFTMSKIHSNTHTGIQFFQCVTCEKAFKYKSHLQRHLITHTGESQYSCFKTLKCDTCGKAFNYQSCLDMHLRSHSGEKPYSCNTCGKRFSQKSSLNTHIRIHTGEKPYTCKTCGKDFRRSGDMTVHMRRSHTGEKP